MLNKIILASKSKVRKEILDKNTNTKCEVKPSNVDEDIVKESLLKKKLHQKLFQKI
jgi:septum formation protein